MLDRSEITVISMAKEANPWWFAFIAECAEYFVTSNCTNDDIEDQFEVVCATALRSGHTLSAIYSESSFLAEVKQFSTQGWDYNKLYPITSKELWAFEQVKGANFWWYIFIMKCAMIMVQRRNKYSKGHHPYFNFADVSRRSGVPMFDVFKVYVAMKESRASVSGDTDYDDESSMDTQYDNVNYTAIEYGALVAGLTADEVWKSDPIFSTK